MLGDGWRAPPRPSHYDLGVALLALGTLLPAVLERIRFRPGAAACKRSETSPEQLPAPSAETAPVPLAASSRNLSNALIRSTSNITGTHLPSPFLRPNTNFAGLRHQGNLPVPPSHMRNRLDMLL